MPRVPEHDIDLSKKFKIIHTYSRTKQARPPDRSVTTYGWQSNSVAQPLPKLGKAKHSRKDSQHRRAQGSDESEDSRRLPRPTPKRPKRKRRLAIEQLVLLPVLSSNDTPLDTRLRVTCIRDGSNEPLDAILTSDTASPDSRGDAGPCALGQPNSWPGKPLSNIRSQLILPKCDQQKPPDLSRFLFPPTPPQPARLQLREVGSGFKDREVQPRKRWRPAVQKRKGKRRVINRKMAPLGLAIAKSLSPKLTDEPQQTPSSLDLPSSSSGGDPVEASTDPVPNIDDGGMVQQDFLSSNNRRSRIDEHRSPNIIEGKNNDSDDMEMLDRNSAVSAPLRVPSDERSPQVFTEVGIATARDLGAYPVRGAHVDWNTPETVSKSIISRSMKSPGKGSNRDHRKGTVRRVSFLYDLPEGRLNSMQTTEAELPESVSGDTLSSILHENPWTASDNRKDQLTVLRNGSLEVAAETHLSAAQSEGLSDTDWKVTLSEMRGKSAGLEDEMLDGESPTFIDHSYYLRQHTSLRMGDALASTTREQPGSESQGSLLLQRMSRQPTFEIPETPRSLGLERQYQQDQGSGPRTETLRRVPTFSMYDETSKPRSQEEDGLIDVRSIPVNPPSPVALSSGHYPAKASRFLESSGGDSDKVIRRKLGLRSTNPEFHEDDLSALLTRRIGAMPNSSRRRDVLTRSDSQHLRMSGRKASVELGSMPSRRQPSLVPLLPPSK